MSLPDTIFIFGLALVIFGPKKLPEIGRQVGKLILEFRRASNEFKMQIEEELRIAEDADLRKQLAAQVSAPPVPAAADASESSGSLTIRPPSTGTIVSADNPSTAPSSEAAEHAVSPEQPNLAIASQPVLEDGLDRGLGSGFEDGFEADLREQTTNHHG